MKKMLSIALVCFLSLLTSVQMTAQTKIIKGDNPYGEVLYNFDGTFFRQGNSKYSKALFNWDGTCIRKGDSKYGEVLYNFDGQYVRRGDSKYSSKLYTISGKIPIGLLIFLLM